MDFFIFTGIAISKGAIIHFHYDCEEFKYDREYFPFFDLLENDLNYLEESCYTSFDISTTWLKNKYMIHIQKIYVVGNYLFKSRDALGGCHVSFEHLREQNLTLGVPCTPIYMWNG